MSQPLQADVGVNEDRTFPAVVYALYLLGYMNGVTWLIGLIVAYANRNSAGPMMRSHYIFQIQSFWLTVWWFLIGAAMCLVGGIFSIILVGIPILLLGIAICSVVGIWFGIRCVLGALYLARNEAYPRPYNWLF